jgi:hypothetical protein
MAVLAVIAKAVKERPKRTSGPTVHLADADLLAACVGQTLPLDLAAQLLVVAPPNLRSAKLQCHARI